MYIEAKEERSTTWAIIYEIEITYSRVGTWFQEMGKLAGAYMNEAVAFCCYQT